MTIKNKRVVALAMAVAMALALLVPALSLTASASNVTTGQRFTDVSPDAWYYEAVTAMADAGIVNGVGNGKFEPTRPMTAGELATVLWNMMYGDWCKATELYQTFTNGYAFGNNNYLTSSYVGPKYGNWGVPAANNDTTAFTLRPTTWDGPVSLMIYGDSRIDPTEGYGNAPYKPVGIGDTINHNSYGRLAGKLYGTDANNIPANDKYYSRDMSGLAVVAMSKENVTRGFAISELVNVLRQTGNLQSVYNASDKKNVYATGASIPDWADITNVYHDVCSASVKSSGDSLYNTKHNYLFHDYSWAWNYIDEPGKTTISGGYANTWFSADVLLAYQAGIVSGKDASGRCDVGASMTRAEVCQMLYNAGVTSLKPKSQANGGISLDVRFIRDNKVYACRPVGTPIVGPYPVIHYCGAYNPSLAAYGDSIYDVYNAKLSEYVDIRQQEWPTHPEFWGN
ncbi:MAG: S-layer homology domain-containing protein [Clostridiales bacterium]|nr:S-layer homology domain-containing protein [Clostridiales bacterium]